MPAPGPLSAPAGAERGRKRNRRDPIIAENGRLSWSALSKSARQATAWCSISPMPPPIISPARRLGLLLKIFDAFRPSEAQWRLWAARPDPEFLADPRRGSPHSRGVAVDLTLVAADGTPLDMGTPFDAFTPLSHHGAPQLPVAAQQNRLLLLGLMSAAGWDFYAREWWHYQLFEPRRYPLLSDSVLPVPMMAG